MAAESRNRGGMMTFKWLKPGEFAFGGHLHRSYFLTDGVRSRRFAVVVPQQSADASFAADGRERHGGQFVGGFSLVAVAIEGVLYNVVESQGSPRSPSRNVTFRPAQAGRTVR